MFRLKEQEQGCALISSAVNHQPFLFQSVRFKCMDDEPLSNMAQVPSLFNSVLRLKSETARLSGGPTIQLNQAELHPRKVYT